MTVPAAQSCSEDDQHDAGLDGHDRRRHACRRSLRARCSGRSSACCVVSDLHLEKGSSFAMRGVLLPPYDTVATLGRLAAVIARYDPRMVIALGDSFHDRDAHERLSAADRDAARRAAGAARLDLDLGQSRSRAAARSRRQRSRARSRSAPITFRHEPTGARGEIAGHLHPKARVADARPRDGAALFCLRRRARRDAGVRRLCRRAQHSRRRVCARSSTSPGFIAHVLGDDRLHAIAATRCC